ncbi:protein tyrosine phosphatase family protein [Magnetococcus sp. PR-3]|uniref:protein tyrosine phosphatase family protein n=1 Tax=Magnetococcus sp. PR-3 TaxID=3120355 RepID=UPI002FCE1619
MTEVVDTLFIYDQRVDAHWICAEQPSEHALVVLAESGYKGVLNLGLHEAPYALEDEAASVTNLKMRYHHIPVSFTNPQVASYEAFAAFLDTIKGQKWLIHCADNKRVSIFMALYQLQQQAWSTQKAVLWIAQAWQPDRVWAEFLGQVRERMLA